MTAEEWSTVGMCTKLFCLVRPTPRFDTSFICRCGEETAEMLEDYVCRQLVENAVEEHPAELCSRSKQATLT